MSGAELARSSGNRHVIWHESAAPEPGDGVPCGVEDNPAHWPDIAVWQGRAAQRNVTSADRLVCRLAIDVDYEFYSGTFGGNLAACTNYVLTLWATVSAIYERDVNVTIQVVYTNIWTGSNDPYTATTASAQLPEFRDYWNLNHPGVSRDLALGAVRFSLGVTTTAADVERGIEVVAEAVQRLRRVRVLS